MTRHLLIAGFLFSSSVALAETADDKPITDEAVESAETEEVAAKQGRGGKGRSGGSKPAARSGSGSKGKPAARSGSNSSSRSSASRSSSTTRTNPNASRSSSSSSSRSSNSSSSRPSNSSSSRPSASNSNRNPAHNASRPSSSSNRASSSRSAHSAAAASHRSSNARPAHTSQASTRPSGRTHRVHRPNWAPKRWAPSYHRYHLRGVPRYSPRYWGAGVFYYNPPPRRHRVVVVNRTVTGSRAGQADTTPTRAVDRDGDFAFGLRGGTYGSEYLGGGGYSDMGLGLTARFRPVEAVGLEVAYEHHSQNFEDDTERINNPLQTSVQVYAFPWTRVSPYATLGLTWNNRSITDDYYNAETRRNEIAQQEGTLFGPHAGLGLELALGDSAALNFEGRFINYVNVEEGDPTVPGAVQGTAGLNFYF